MNAYTASSKSSVTVSWLSMSHVLNRSGAAAIARLALMTSASLVSPNRFRAASITPGSTRVEIFFERTPVTTPWCVRKTTARATDGSRAIRLANALLLNTRIMSLSTVDWLVFPCRRAGRAAGPMLVGAVTPDLVPPCCRLVCAIGVSLVSDVSIINVRHMHDSSGDRPAQSVGNSSLRKPCRVCHAFTASITWSSFLCSSVPS
ncbi:hypothetical protein GDI2750 [Gluconacetobacter diazotrophicus PA1 5]|uniref:Uncharacterized protein n=1 Tax=Gluconacetobacter diazotrophicus (strain ATCC 49037 / DSM 5601 / CCUG 37298 / CIP 103539 / LMG 7603 / PAl5) TaxID=272568 RepID=A9HQ86_GLUDA|nr:hypothetical protein GDI2750 [Gluconacetobacter diazotrophicus PA1 5]